MLTGSAGPLLKMLPLTDVTNFVCEQNIYCGLLDKFDWNSDNNSYILICTLFPHLTKLWFFCSHFLAFTFTYFPCFILKFVLASFLCTPANDHQSAHLFIFWCFSSQSLLGFVHGQIFCVLHVAWYHFALYWAFSVFT